MENTPENEVKAVSDKITVAIPRWLVDSIKAATNMRPSDILTHLGIDWLNGDITIKPLKGGLWDKK